MSVDPGAAALDDEGRSVVDEVLALLPLVQAKRAQGEEQYRMAEDVVEALGQIGLFRLLFPREYGGASLPVPALVRVHEQLAYADPSVAWASVNSNSVAHVIARMDPDDLDEVLMPAASFYGIGLPVGGRAVKTDGGYRVSGRWPVVSGAADAGWFALHCLVLPEDEAVSDGGVPERRFVLVPASAVLVEDTWRGVVAFHGSGSNAVTVSDAFVPATRSASLAAATRFPRPHDCFHFFALGSLQMAAIATGIARRGVEAAITQASARVSMVSATGWADWPAVQNTVASADIAAETTRAGLFSVAEDCWREAELGELQPRTRARLHSIADHAFRTGRHLVSDLFTVGSVDALRPGHGLEQALRDLHGFSVQWERFRNLHFEAGRVLLGGDAKDPRF